MYKCNDMFQMQSHTLYQNIIFMTGYNSINRKHLHCINFTLTKMGMSVKKFQYTETKPVKEFQ
jgi:hypothetical protein